jgi:nucleotide-binding universal stress UspA family protein
MFCPNRILVPVDFSASAIPASRCAHDVARIFGSRVHLLHVATEPAAGGWLAVASSAALERRAEARVDAMRELASFAALATQPGGERLGRLGPTLAVRVSDDTPATILAYAREAGCDLIVMGTHRGAPLALLRSSTADWVRRHAECPVILVPPVVEALAREPRVEPFEAALAATF